MGVVLVVLAVVVGAVVITGGGNTVEGFGHDMKKTGDKIETKTGN